MPKAVEPPITTSIEATVHELEKQIQKLKRRLKRLVREHHELERVVNCSLPQAGAEWQVPCGFHHKVLGSIPTHAYARAREKDFAIWAGSMPMPGIRGPRTSLRATPRENGRSLSALKNQ